MRRSRLFPPGYALTLGALILALASVSGCERPRGGVASASGIITHTVSGWVSSQIPHTELSISCQPGEQMIGGGFSASGSFEYDARIVASYPSNPNTWTVAAASSPAFTLNVEVYCLPVNPALGVIIAQALAAPTGSLSCPAGATLLSGGFQGDSPVSASRPDGNGWYVAGASGSNEQVYILCVSQRISEGGVVAASLDPHSSAHNYSPATQSLDCPAGQTATSGGFSGGGLVLASASKGAPYQSWTVTAGGDGALTLYARCVHLTR
jgi:hypothetical protein